MHHQVVPTKLVGKVEKRFFGDIPKHSGLQVSARAKLQYDLDGAFYGTQVCIYLPLLLAISSVLQIVLCFQDDSTYQYGDVTIPMKGQEWSLFVFVIVQGLLMHMCLKGADIQHRLNRYYLLLDTQIEVTEHDFSEHKIFHKKVSMAAVVLCWVANFAWLVWWWTNLESFFEDQDITEDKG